MYGTQFGDDRDRTVTVEVPDGDRRVGTVTLQRPDVRNAMSIELCRSAAAALHGLADEASVVVLRGAGGNFSTGGDIDEVRRLREEGPEALSEIFDAFASLIQAVLDVEVPVVAAVEGYALAGGFELLQVCDVVLLSETAVLGDHHIRAGQVPAGGGSQRLPRLVGRQRALAHLLTGDRIDSTTAVAWGLAYRWAPADEFDAMVSEVVDRMASTDPAALRTMKSLVVRGLRHDLDEGLQMERRAVLDASSWREFE